jgi:hypothetical protein
MVAKYARAPDSWRVRRAVKKIAGMLEIGTKLRIHLELSISYERRVVGDQIPNQIPKL